MFWTLNKCQASFSPCILNNIPNTIVEMITVGFTLCLAATLILAYLYNQKKPKNFPPGPWGFPILGHFPLIGREPHKTFMEWKAKYGPIIGVDFGSIRTVIISDYELAKEAFNESAFAGRPKIPFIYDRSEGHPEGIVLNIGKHWIEQRNFTMRTLREFGFGKKSLEGIIQDEIREVIERFKQSVGTPINLRGQFNIAATNALWTITTGERFDQDDPDLNNLMSTITTASADNNVSSQAALFMPWLSKLAPNASGYNNLINIFQATKDFIRKPIEYHFDTNEPGQPRDFIDSFIDEMKKSTDSTSSFHTSNKNSLYYNVADILLAGSETTSTALLWICLYMAKYPVVQEKLAEEVHRVVGNSRLPALEDKLDMPYAEAVINEVQRSATMLPLSVFHATTEDVLFQGYNIPKDTMVFINVYEAHNNKELWGDPENFRPERFLSRDGLFERREGLMPFSTGKRVCPGESLARDELFLFTTALVQAFELSLDHSSPPPSLQPINGSVAVPQPHKLALALRN